ncbi:hypothetical protein N7456_002020 [Penicillium angulare]|uniref:Stigma-specific protein Stig1 n=1 Tax=Penicillium angulare TaxID=116970 RepID=A0A9W9G7C3_9EURO|nr:hypothetical protein N7456_002020 [Penicillium angulare]
MTLLHTLGIVIAGLVLSDAKPFDVTPSVVSTVRATPLSVGDPGWLCAPFFPWKPCPTNQTCCNFNCVNTTSDVNNCGGCNAPCAGQQVPGCCSGNCTDFGTSLTNCGSCNNTSLSLRSVMDQILLAVLEVVQISPHHSTNAAVALPYP